MINKHLQLFGISVTPRFQESSGHSVPSSWIRYYLYSVYPKIDSLPLQFIQRTSTTITSLLIQMANVVDKQNVTTLANQQQERQYFFLTTLRSSECCSLAKFINTCRNNDTLLKRKSFCDKSS